MTLKTIADLEQNDWKETNQGVAMTKSKSRPEQNWNATVGL